MQRCFRCGAPTLSGEWHHRRGKAVKDSHTHCPCNGIWLCGTCHRDVHAQPLVSMVPGNGWIVSRYEGQPGLVPTLSHYGALLLQCDGKIRYYIEE